MKKTLISLLIIIALLILNGGTACADKTVYAPINNFLLTYPNGDRYEGNVVNGMFHGRGVFVWANGERYEGDFFLNERTGRGIYIWTDGARYEGDFIGGKRTGQGIYVWPEGEYYEGQFIDGLPTGNGVYVWSMKNHENIMLENAKRSRRFIFLWPKTKIELNNYFSNTLRAKGIMLISDGRGDFVIGTLKQKGVFILSRRLI